MLALPDSEAHLLAVYFEERAQYTSELNRKLNDGNHHDSITEASIGDDLEDGDEEE